MTTEMLAKLDSNQNDCMTKEEEEEILKVILGITAELKAFNAEFNLNLSSLKNSINALPNQINLIIEQEFRAIASSLNDINESIEALPTQITLEAKHQFKPLVSSINRIEKLIN